MKHHLRLMLERALAEMETPEAPSSSGHEEPLPAEEPRASEAAGDEITAPHSEVASGENQETVSHYERNRRRKGKQKVEEEEEEEHGREEAPRRKKGKQMAQEEEMQQQIQQRRLEAREMMASKIGLENPAWAVQKTLFVSDVSEHQHRLQLPRSAVEGSPLLGVMTPEETAEMHGRGATIVVLDRLGNKYSMLFRDVGNNNGFRILGADWMKYVRQNKLQEGDSLDLWAFRRLCEDKEKTELVFVLLRHQNQNQNQNQRKESEKKAKASSSSSSCRLQQKIMKTHFLGC